MCGEGLVCMCCGVGWCTSVVVGWCTSVVRGGGALLCRISICCVQGYIFFYVYCCVAKGVSFRITMQLCGLWLYCWGGGGQYYILFV